MKTFTVLQAARRFDAQGFNSIGDDLSHTAAVVATVLKLAGIPYELTAPDDSGEERFTPAAAPAPEPSAFPQFAAWQRGGQIECGTYGHGLSQRAYVAARCLQGLLANADFEPIHNAPETKAEAYARRAVDFADALLARLAASEGKDVAP